MSRPVDLDSFFADWPVFTLGQLAKARGDESRLEPTRNQLKRHIASGRVKSVARGIYAAVPPGLKADLFHPDPFLVAAAARPGGVFAYHSALELLGSSQSVWHQVTLSCHRRRSPIDVGPVRILFLATPGALQRQNLARLATQTVLHQSRHLMTTGPERTLVEGFRRPHLVGGFDELLDSVSGIPLIDFKLLQRVLEVYDERALWAAVGWTTERNRQQWSTPESFLATCHSHQPKQNQYVVRGLQGGRLVRDWRLIVPAHLLEGFEGHATNR